MDAAKQVTATFSRTTYTLAVSRTGTGTGATWGATAWTPGSRAAAARQIHNPPSWQPQVQAGEQSPPFAGSGAGVDKVRAATELVRQREPDLLVEGPIQYDAAVEPSVAASKMPNSAVAGRATVLIFPDLNTGNNTYKAVQRSAGAIAIGPVLQGLNKPVNDLSRGALVEDIVYTVAITAIQAQGA
jgi:phosphate acetyltransferase